MLSLRIDHLKVVIDTAGGQGHRLQPIVVRAVSLLADRFVERWGEGLRTSGSRDVAVLGARPVSLDLNRTSDEEAAGAIAQAWFEALTQKVVV